ncbi:D-alanyl-D-alanine carboxypeptidase family protein [Candidatus Allofournierella merdipullorum]|uniref:D-alanyl-D-alanine carboxypeptidase family protein n=1 Tax=Candidatus Allofournierella merdipullorum TaxID=2838595 RepID=UPI002A8B7BE8|nr:D-alanyl-D-alanine carboxypeptidase family protein [Candidatus Fournierella merdipullorum]
MLKKRLLALALCCVLAAALCMPAAAEPLAAGRFALPDFDVPCRAAVLIDLSSGTVLYEKEPDTPMPIASITKVMTLLLTFEAIEAGKVSLQDTVPVSDHAYNMGGSQIWLEPGETFTLDEMVKAICVSSANDAAVAVAEFIGGSEPAFAELMNQKAAELGMTNTAFKNACGLDEAGHLSTARDVAIMSREMLLNHPRITDYTTIWMDTLRGGQTQLLNTNKLLKRYQGVTGLKSGTTSGAGVCISASASRDGLDLLAVVLGAASSNERFDAATALLDYGFANFENVAAPAPENAPASLPVTGGAQETVELRYAAPEKILVQKGEGAALTAELELPQTLAAPLAEGQQVGAVTVYSGETALGSWPVTAASAVQPMTMRLGFERLLAALTAH